MGMTSTGSDNVESRATRATHATSLMEVLRSRRNQKQDNPTLPANIGVGHHDALVSMVDQRTPPAILGVAAIVGDICDAGDKAIACGIIHNVQGHLCFGCGRAFAPVNAYSHYCSAQCSTPNSMTPGAPTGPAPEKVAQGKDVGDMAGTPGLVRAWIEAAPLPDRKPEQVTVDSAKARIIQPLIPCLESAPESGPVEGASPKGMAACILAIETVFGPVSIESTENGPTPGYPEVVSQNGPQEAREGFAETDGKENEAMPLTPCITNPAAQLLDPLPVLAAGQIHCAGCGQPFTPSRPARIYCSARCSNTVSQLPARQTPIEPKKARLSPWTPMGPSLEEAREGVTV